MPVNSRFARWRFGLAIVVAITAILGLIAFQRLPGGGLDPRILSLTASEVKDYAEAWAPWSAVVSIGLMVLHSFLPLPAEIIAVANGMMFGVVGGILITWIGAMLGATLSFGIARSFGRPGLRRLVSERQWRTINSWELRPASLLLARLIPLISFNLINYGAGLAGVAWWPFLWTTSIGILPLTVVSVAFGDAILQASWELTALIIVGAVFFWSLLHHSRLHHITRDIFVRSADPSGNEQSRPSRTAAETPTDTAADESS
jgi:uncharacterized membrane protein YdjX (TVP38/TMEM64 family)